MEHSDTPSQPEDFRVSPDLVPLVCTVPLTYLFFFQTNVVSLKKKEIGLAWRRFIFAKFANKEIAVDAVVRSFDGLGGEIPPLKIGQLLLCEVDSKVQDIFKEGIDKLSMEDIAQKFKDESALYMGWLVKRSDDTVTVRSQATNEDRDFRPNEIILVFPATISEIRRGGADFLVDLIDGMQDAITQIIENNKPQPEED